MNEIGHSHRMVHMKKWRIEYSDAFKPSPLSFWVHRNLDGESWLRATRYEPGLPKPVPARGFPILIVDVAGVELRFSSVEEVEHFLAVVGQKNMPTPSRLSRQRHTSHGPNAHWLSRLPAELKPWRKREKLVPIVQSALKELKALYL